MGRGECYAKAARLDAEIGYGAASLLLDSVRGLRAGDPAGAAGGTVQSALSAVLTYLRGPAAAFLLGLVGPGVFLLPALSALQGFFLSYSVACFAAALGRGGVKLALCAFGVRCAFILPCTFFLAAWGMRTAYARLRGPKKRRAPLTGADRTRLALCALLLAAGVFAELTAVPKLLQLGLAAIT